MSRVCVVVVVVVVVDWWFFVCWVVCYRSSWRRGVQFSFVDGEKEETDGELVPSVRKTFVVELAVNLLDATPRTIVRCCSFVRKSSREFCTIVRCCC